MFSFTPEGAYVDFQHLYKLKIIEKKKSAKNKYIKKSSIMGDFITANIGHGLEYFDIREYQTGDDIRNIDWKTTAKKQKLHTKLYHQEENYSCFLIIDQSCSMFFGSQKAFKSVSAAHVFAHYGWQACLAGHPVGCYIFNEKEDVFLPAKRGEKKFIFILKELTRFNNMLRASIVNKIKLNLKISLQKIKSRLSKGCLILIISDFCDWDEELASIIRYLNYKNELQLIKINDILEKTLPDKCGVLDFFDGKNKISINGFSDNHRQLWHQIYLNKENKIKEFCKSQKIKIYLADDQSFVLS